MSSQSFPATADVAIIGGSYAGLSAAINLLRGRRSVTLFDSGVTRNRFASAAHGFLGQDGVPPDAIRLKGRAEVMEYPTLRLIEDRVQTVHRDKDGVFVLASAQSPEVRAARLILAFGMTDILPDVPGLAEAWGKSAFQCPYCHGYEARDRKTAILMTSPVSIHHATMLRDWTADLTLLTNGIPVEPADRERLQAGGVRFADGRVMRVIEKNGQVSGVETDSGALVACEAVYLHSKARPSCDLADQLGCATVEGPFGPYLQVDDMQQTSVPQVWAAGDITRAAYGAVFAAADGVKAGIAAHRSLWMGG